NKLYGNWNKNPVSGMAPAGECGFHAQNGVHSHSETSPGSGIRQHSRSPVCADAYAFSLLEKSSLTGAKVSQALPCLDGKLKGNRAGMEAPAPRMLRKRGIAEAESSRGRDWQAGNSGSFSLYSSAYQSP